ncbi:MAG: hypothetical protein JWQ63_2563 [Mucilaginibacter sp.]|nr:hypothetical protein [Mucilaginibacter sp.]
MSTKTIVAIGITLLLTIVLMQNTDKVDFAFLWANFRISKLVMMAVVSVFSFILGVLAGRPKSAKRFDDENLDNRFGKGNTNTLSEEDKDYIS